MAFLPMFALIKIAKTLVCVSLCYKDGEQGDIAISQESLHIISVYGMMCLDVCVLPSTACFATWKRWVISIL